MPTFTEAIFLQMGRKVVTDANVEQMWDNKLFFNILLDKSWICFSTPPGGWRSGLLFQT